MKWINKTTFLNGFIKEELYMMQPEGFVNPKGANKMCKLQRSIYVEIDPIVLSLVATIHTCRFPFCHWDQAP